MRQKLKQKMQEWVVFSWRDLSVTIAILICAMILCVVLRRMDDRGNFASMIFVMAVMVVSRLTTGYLFGVAASFIGVIGVNYAFTYPYLALNFTLAGYPMTFMTMLLVSISTCALTNQLRGQERLRAESEKEKMRANLLRAVSHDIRTPLTSIIGSTSAVLESSDLQEDDRQLLMDARTDAQWLIRVVENMLSVTRMGTEGAHIQKEPEAAEEVLASVAQVFRKRFPEMGISVEAPEEFLLVPMDPILIQQVLANLLENAVVHGETTTMVRMRVARDKGNAWFSVRDNGNGIPEKELPYMFNGSFRPSGDSQQGGKRNMGLGLMVCTAIVHAHGGSITAQNLPEGGAEITFSLPLDEEGSCDHSRKDFGN